MPQSCLVRAIAAGGWGAEDNAWAMFFMDHAVSVETQWDAHGRRCLALSQSLASIHFQAVGGRAEGVDPLLSHKKVADWPPQQEALGIDQDTESVAMFPQSRKINV